MSDRVRVTKSDDVGRQGGGVYIKSEEPHLIENVGCCGAWLGIIKHACLLQSYKWINWSLTQVSKVFDRFINVHTLKITFSQCTIRELHKDSLNDDTVREVIRRFPQLKVLKMFACHNLSNRILNTFPTTIDELVLYNGRRWVLYPREISLEIFGNLYLRNHESNLVQLGIQNSGKSEWVEGDEIPLWPMRFSLHTCK